MDKQTLIENDFVSLYWYPEQDIVHHIIHEFVFGETFRNMMTKGADIFIEKDCNKWLSDDKSNPLKKEDIEWCHKNWEPRILDAGLDYWALVMPESETARIDREEIITRYAQKEVDLNIVENEQKGLEWLTKRN